MKREDERDQLLDGMMHKELFILDVTVPVQFSIDLNMDEGRGGINICSGQRTKQYRPGFFNPIPSCLPDSDEPYLCLIIKVK